MDYPIFIYQKGVDGSVNTEFRLGVMTDRLAFESEHYFWIYFAVVSAQQKELIDERIRNNNKKTRENGKPAAKYSKDLIKSIDDLLGIETHEPPIRKFF